MKKILLSLIALMSFCMANATVYTITSDDIANNGTGDVALAVNGYGSQAVATESTWYTCAVSGINFTGCRICVASAANGGVIQMQGNASDAAKQGFFGNTTAFKNINYIKVYARTTTSSTYAPSFNVYAGTSELPADGAATSPEPETSSDDSYKYFTYTYRMPGSTYFAIRNDLTGALYIDKIEIDGEMDGAPVVTIDKPTISVATGTYYEAQNVTITAASGYGLIYTLDGTTPQDGNGTTVAEGTATITVDKTTTIKAISIDNNDPDNCSGVATSTITITKKVANTPETAYTVAQALEYANEGVTDSIYVKGTVVADGLSISTSYGNANYYITSGTDTIYVYRGYYLGNVKFTSEDQIKGGDEVIIYGLVTLYNTTPEFKQGNYIYSLNGDTGKDTPKTYVSQITMDQFTNTGFETWTNGVADQWKSTSNASSATVSQSAEAHTGSSAALVAGLKSGNKRLASTEIKVPAGTYTIEAYVKAAVDTAAVRLGYAIATVNEDTTAYTINSSTGYKYAANDTIYANEGWVNEKYTFELTDETIICVLIMNSKNLGKDVLVDDVVLRAATDEEKQALSVTAVAAEKKSAKGIYTVAGQRLNATRKGLNIVDGQKVYIK